MTWLSSRAARGILLGLLICAALLSAGRGAQNGFRSSQDFQWAGARLLLDHIDPWRDALAGDPLHRIILTQDPNYLPILYVLFAPLALLDRVPAQTVWVVCNILFAVVSAWIAARFYGLGRFGTAATICVLLAATPVRMTIGNGQQGLFVLLLWSLGLLTLRVSGRRATLAGFSFLKYNFAPPVVMLIWLRAGVRAVLFSFIPAAVGVVLVWLWLSGGRSLETLGWVIVAPFRLSRMGYFPSGGGSNLMDVLEVPLYAVRLSRNVVEVGTLFLALVLCFVALRRATRSAPMSVQAQIALLSVLSFSLFKHHTYDSVVLLYALCFLVRLRHQPFAQLALVMLGYIWFAERWVDQFLPRIAEWTFIPEFLMLMVVAWAIFRLRSAESTIFAA